MLRAPFASERIERIDPHTGVKVVQITSYPTPSVHLLYDWPSVTPDNERVVLLTQRWTERTAPWDVYRCDTDGLNLFQLTERGLDRAADRELRPACVLSLDGKTVYAVWPDEHILCKVDVETGETEELMSLDRYMRDRSWMISSLKFGRMGKRLFVDIRNYGQGNARLVAIDLGTGAVKDDYPLNMTVYAFDQENDRVIVVKNFVKLGTKKRADAVRIFTNENAEPMTLWSVDEDGSDEQYISTIDMFGHSTMLGRVGKIQGTGQPPHRCIWIAEAGKEPYKLVQGPYFWHSSASFDGEWILSDTQWPDVGLQLVHVPTRRFRTVCRARASQGHVQSSHPHPALSQDGRVGVFDSDRTGVSQVYLVRITDEFRETVKAGVLDDPEDKWM